MKLTHYARAEQRIASADGSGIVERWRYGRALLADPTATNPAGTLRRGRGIAAQLIAAARARGLSLSEREIQRRLQLARTYPTEAASRQALAVYGTWEQLAAAGFPALDDPAAGPQLTLVDQDGAVDPAAEPWQQATLDDDGSVFPATIRIAGTPHDLDGCTLRALAGYLADRERWTASHARRNAEMREHLTALLDAVRGDQGATYAAAVQAYRRGAA